MGLKRKKRNFYQKQLKKQRLQKSKFIWMKIRGVSIFWPVKVVTETCDRIEIFIKSDNAQFEVRKQEKNIQPFQENLERLKAQGIGYLQAKAMKETERCFMEDIEYATNESDDDSVEDKTCSTNPTEIESESDDDSVEDKTCLTNPTEKESESDDDSVEGKTCLTNPTEKESESDDDSVEDKTCSTNPTEKESESDDDSVEDKTVFSILQSKGFTSGV